MMHRPKYKISHYSAFAAIFLLSKSGHAEAIYTDIDPDIILTLDNDFYNIDMNNDGLPDFKLQKISGSFYSYWSENMSYSNYIVISPWQSGNKIAGIKSVIDPSYGGFTQYFPFAINSMELINDDLAFQNNNFEILAYVIHSDGGASKANGGYWQDGIENKLLGVRFVDNLGCFHYGWIRCSAAPDADSLIIQDFAYETKCEIGIYAGDTIGDTTTVAITELNLFTPTILSYNGTIKINVNRELVGSYFSIVNLEGKIICTGTLNEINNTFDINTDKGIYIFTINKQEYKYSKQIFIL